MCSDSHFTQMPNKVIAVAIEFCLSAFSFLKPTISTISCPSRGRIHCIDKLHGLAFRHVWNAGLETPDAQQSGRRPLASAVSDYLHGFISSGATECHNDTFLIATVFRAARIGLIPQEVAVVSFPRHLHCLLGGDLEVAEWGYEAMSANIAVHARSVNELHWIWL